MQKWWGSLLKERDWKRLLWLCLPAVAIGLGVRIWLMSAMPHAFIQPDSIDLLTTPDHLLRKGEWYIAPKKTFLTPLLYTLTFFLPSPVLTTIAFGQHALGLLLILISGILCRLWFRHSYFLIPIVTMLMAINPTLLWYEHTLMAESHYVFFVVLTALMGTLFARQKTAFFFVAFLISLFLTAGSRPEGKLFFAFGLLLTFLVSYRNWRTLAWQFSLLLLLAIGTSRLTKSSQAGLLLYTSVITLTPDKIKSAPGFETYVLLTRDRLRNEWKHRYYDMAAVRKEITRAAQNYLKTQNLNTNSKAVNKLCFKLALETCLKNPSQLPHMALMKFRQSLLKLASGSFDERWLIDRQIKTVRSDFDILTRKTKKLTGEKLISLTDYENFVKTHYHLASSHFFRKLQKNWNQFQNFGISSPQNLIQLPFIPPFYWLALLGLLLSPLLKKELLSFHSTWALMILGLWFVIFLTANTKERFRFIFEPFWILYLAALIDLLITILKRCFASARMKPGEIPKSDKLKIYSPQ